MEITRQRLYELVWSAPRNEVAKKLSITTTEVTKLCTALHVPSPSDGYWAVKALGGTLPPRPPLPENNESSTTAQVVNGQILAADPKSLHPLIRKALARRSSGRGYWGLDIDVSEPLEPRALRIMDMVFRAIEAKGGRAMIAMSAPDEIFEEGDVCDTLSTYAEHDGIWFYVRIRERQKEVVPRELNSCRRYVPSGYLCLETTPTGGCGRAVKLRDTNSRCIESSLDEHIERMTRRATEETAQRAKREAEVLHQEAVQAREDLLDAWHRKVRTSQDTLMQCAESWRRAKMIRALLNSIGEHPTLEETPWLEDWKKWASEQASWLETLSLKGALLAYGTAQAMKESVQPTKAERAWAAQLVSKATITSLAIDTKSPSYVENRPWYPYGRGWYRR